MTTTILPTNHAASGFSAIPLLGTVSDVVSRSKAMATKLIQEKPIADHLIDAFCNPVNYRGEAPGLEQAVMHLAEILSNSAGSPLTPIRFERHQQILRGVTTSLIWLYRESKWEHRKSFEQLALQALLPVYIAPASENWESALKSTMSGLRRLSCLTQFCQLLERDGMHDWLESDSRVHLPPQESMERAFRICISRMADAYWSFLNPNVLASSMYSNQADQAGIEKGLWSIALQLTKRTTKLTIPANLRIGVVSWERVLQHWETLSAHLKEATETTSKRVAHNDTKTATTPSPSVKSSEPVKAERDHRLAEIRSSGDPQLAKNLDRILQQCKKNQSIFSLVVVKRMENAEISSNSADIGGWQTRLIDAMVAESETADIRGFTTDNEELALVFVDADRAELSTWIRESFTKISAAGKGMSMTEVEPLVAGISMVNGPSRAFAIEQLIDGAWRCLDGASLQGTHAVKTIEVY